MSCIRRAKYTHFPRQPLARSTWWRTRRCNPSRDIAAFVQVLGQQVTLPRYKVGRPVSCHPRPGVNKPHPPGGRHRPDSSLLISLQHNASSSKMDHQALDSWSMARSLPLPLALAARHLIPGDRQGSPWDKCHETQISRTKGASCSNQKIKTLSLKAIGIQKKSLVPAKMFTSEAFPIKHRPHIDEVAPTNESGSVSKSRLAQLLLPSHPPSFFSWK